MVPVTQMPENAFFNVLFLSVNIQILPLLFAIRYSLFAIRYSLFAIRYSLFSFPDIQAKQGKQKQIILVINSNCNVWKVSVAKDEVLKKHLECPEE
jgi:hypothetical protein